MGCKRLENNFFSPLEVVHQKKGVPHEKKCSRGFSYAYNYTDHLGNVRLTYSDTDGDGYVAQDEIISEKHYYPFGLQQKGYNDVISANVNPVANRYSYGSKELNDELGLNWYDISARNYDPAIGRWMNIDPLAEKFVEFSPYTFAKNNPIFFVDPNGEEPVPGPFTNKGWRNSNGSITVFRITSGQRYALDIYYATSVASTGWIGQVVGGAISIQGSVNTSESESIGTHVGVTSQVASQTLTDVINSPAVSGNSSKGIPSAIGEAFDKNGRKIINGNPVKSVVNKANGVLQWAGVASALASDSSPSRNELVSKWTFQFADAYIRNGNTNIAQEGLFTVYDKNATVEGVESKLNAIHAGINIFLAGTDFDLSTTRGRNDAASYISENAQYISSLVRHIYNYYNDRDENNKENN